MPARIPASGKRPRLAIVAAAAAFVVLVAWASCVRVRDDGERVYRLSPGAREATRLDPGWRLRLPWLQRLVRVPAGPLRARGEVPLRAREGLDLQAPFEVSAEIGDAALATLLGKRGDPEAILREAASTAIAAWGKDASGEALVLRVGADVIVESTRARLEPLGFDQVALRLERIAGPAGTIAAIEAGALRERVVATGSKVAILGLDGADWEIIDPLIAAGQLPNLARLKARGAWANMKTMSPALSPLLWTSVATGKPPEEHGIIDFLVQDATTGQAVPVSSRWRKVKALWNIFTDVGRRSGFIAWWATWPAERVDGWMVSDRIAYSLFGFEASDADRDGATHPAEYFQEIKPALVHDGQITLADVRAFVQVSPEEFAALRARIRENPKLAYREPVNHLTKILASTRSYHAVALDLLERGQPDLFSVYYQGIDEVCHRFAHYMPPRMAMAAPEEYARYKDAVFAFYRYQDRLLGEVLARLAPGTTTIVLSDHGFKNGSGRPADEPPYIEGKPGLWHRRYGVFIAAGPEIEPGPLDTVSLLDIAPTVLYLSGLPVADDMDGRVLTEAIDDRFEARFPRHTIPSYETVGRPLADSQPLVATSGVDAEMVEKLRSLGYVGGADPGAGASPAGDGLAGAGPDGALVTGHLNEAGLHLKNKEYRKAEAAVAKALALQPSFVPALILTAQIAAAQKRWGEAIGAAKQVVALDAEGERGVYIELGRIYADSGGVEEGVAYLRGLASAHPGVAEIRSALGTLLLRSGRTAEAERELLDAVRLDPAAGEPLAELHKLYGGTDKVLALEPIVRKGLEINDKSVVHRNWMGLIHEWKREFPRAEEEFRRALALDPDYASTMANLGALYGRTGRLPEAVEILTRATSKDPENLEAWVNLGAAQGRLGKAREAIAALETARRKGVRTTTLFNALALSYLQDRQKAKAVEYLKESLKLDPGQKDARDLLQAVNRGS